MKQTRLGGSGRSRVFSRDSGGHRSDRSSWQTPSDSYGPGCVLSTLHTLTYFLKGLTGPKCLEMQGVRLHLHSTSLNIEKMSTGHIGELRGGPGLTDS